MAQTATRFGAEDVRWRLDELYASPTDPALEADLSWGLRTAQEFEARYKGRLAELEPADFRTMMEDLEEHYEGTSKPGIYAQLLHSQNTADPAAGRLMARVREAGAERGKHGVFFSLELAHLDDDRAERLAADPTTARYRHTIESARKYRPHQLGEPEERILTEYSPVTSAWVRLFEELCAAIRVEVRGDEMALEEALSMQYQGDRELRKAAAEGVTAALRRDLRTRAYVFNVMLQEKAIDDRVRSYPSWISVRNLANETSDAAVQALIEAVTGRYDVVSRYYRAKRRMLGLDQLFEWDRYAPVGDATREITWEGAKELVLGTYHRFSARAGGLVDEFFERSWIDAPVADGKRGGAYCMAATPRFHPFVMLNFTGKLNDALTLAHELGHGLHDRLAAEQHIFDFHPPLTLAETASVFGEALTFDRIMAEEGDPKIRLSMLCGQVEGAIATIFRQVAMNRFEDACHVLRRQEGELAPEKLGQLWLENLRRMFGDSLTLTDEHAVWFSYVGHFIHTPGYVYAYAFGNLLALSIYQRYREAGPGFVDSYLAFLAAGGSQRPDELVRGLGMDVTDPGFWDAGLAILDGMVGQVEELAQA
ncbi:MAG: M3 family oligoendopeptidase [Candidatus Dormibacteraceae bacterium]